MTHNLALWCVVIYAAIAAAVTLAAAWNLGRNEIGPRVSESAVAAAAGIGAFWPLAVAWVLIVEVIITPTEWAYRAGMKWRDR